jgi:hypothetical protein
MRGGEKLRRVLEAILLLLRCFNALGSTLAEKIIQRYWNTVWDLCWT